MILYKAIINHGSGTKKVKILANYFDEALLFARSLNYDKKFRL